MPPSVMNSQDSSQMTNHNINNKPQDDKDYPLIIRDSKDRFTLFPLNPKHQEFWNLYEDSMKQMWMVSEVNMSDDKSDWDEKLNDKQRHFLKYVISFFAGSDKLVAENVACNFSKEIDVWEAQMFYNVQVMMEDIHSHMYSILVDTYISDPKERNYINNAIMTMPVIKQKQDWAKKYSDPDNASFAKRLVAFAVVEGVFFSASFAAIYYIREFGILPGLCKSNDFIAKDEGIHCKFACTLYKYCKEKLSQEEIHGIFSEAVEVEIAFIEEAIPVDLINLPSEDMIEYIKFIADFWIQTLGYKPLYNASNPLDFMKKTGIFRMTNFFESKEDNYQTYFEQSGEFNLDEDF